MLVRLEEREVGFDVFADRHGFSTRQGLDRIVGAGEIAVLVGAVNRDDVLDEMLRHSNRFQPRAKVLKAFRFVADCAAQ